VLQQVAAERIDELLTRETMLKNEIQQLNEQISALHCRHTDELERLGRENAAEVEKLMDELARQKELNEGVDVERERQSELVYYQRHLESAEQIAELHDTVAKLHAEIEDMRGDLQCRDAEIEQLKANVSPLDTSVGGLLAAIQLDLERAIAER